MTARPGPMKRTLATALASAERAQPELAAAVVTEALARAGGGIARSVLLFLSADFTRTAQAAVTAAARAANCLQIAGCTAPGVFTEDDWIIDRPAACALVLGGAAALAGGGEPLLSLALPAAAGEAWLARSAQRLGLLATSGATLAPGAVWCHGKLAADGRCEAAFAGTSGTIGVSRGIRILGPALEATRCAGYDLLRLDTSAALDALMRRLPELSGPEHLPLHLLSAGVVRGAPERAFDEGRYELLPLIAVSAQARSVTLGAPVTPGSRVFWALRQPLAAEQDTRHALDTARAALDGEPDFAVMFSCLGRGPYFFGGVDQDLEAVKQRFPALPLIGAYGAGEIAPVAGRSQILHNTAAIGLFSLHV